MPVKISVLFVEDDLDFAAPIVEHLEANDISVVHATNVKEALSKMKNQKFACVVTDIRLGEESGEVIVSYLREKKSGIMLNAPVIVTSGFVDRELLERLKSSVQGVFVKPFDPDKLVDKIKQCVAK